MAPAVRQHPEARPPGIEVLMPEISLARSAQVSPELVECFRHEGEGCPRCDGSGFRPRKRCERCGEPSGRPSEGGRALMGMPMSAAGISRCGAFFATRSIALSTRFGVRLRGWAADDRSGHLLRRSVRKLRPLLGFASCTGEDADASVYLLRFDR